MKLVIDNMDSLTGWTGTNADVHGLNAINQYIAGDNDNSIIFKFDTLGGYVVKTCNINVSDYNELTLHIWSQTKGVSDYKTTSDFSYKIDLGGGNVYYIPAHKTFTDVTLDISDVNTITQIKIISAHASTDYLVMSYIVAYTTEIPLDVMQGIKEQLDSYILSNYATKYPLGTITGETGDTSITFSSVPDYLDRYACVKIGSEIHQIKHKNRKVYEFTSLYDGGSLGSDYTNEQVYLYIPVEFGRRVGMEILLPSITIWGIIGDLDPTPNSRLDTILDTWKDDDTVQERQEGVYTGYSFLIDAEARHDSLLAELSRIIKIVLNRHKLWVNGKKFLITQDGTPVDVGTFQDITIPKVQYTARVTIKEELWERTTRSPVTTSNQTIAIE